MFDRNFMKNMFYMLLTKWNSAFKEIQFGIFNMCTVVGFVFRVLDFCENIVPFVLYNFYIFNKITKKCIYPKIKSQSAHLTTLN